MGTTVWKYVLKITALQTIAMPRGAEVLSVHLQRGAACMWARVDRTAPLEQREFVTLATGDNNDAPPLGRFLGTFQTDNELFVFHVFEGAPS